MSLHIQIFYNHNDISLNIEPDTTLNSIFTMVKEPLEIEGNNDDYYFFLHIPCSINSTAISVIMDDFLNDNRIFIISKNEYTTLDNYLVNFLPSLVAQSSEFTQEAQNIIRHISTLHKFIANFIRDDVSASILSVIPFDRIDDLEGDNKVSEIAKWFKEEFFIYMKEIKCNNCGSETKCINKNGGVSKEEAKHLANHCELYECQKCGAVTRFPRYNDVCKLLETRQGRCGEFANTFGAILKSIGYDVRLVCDLNDYIWVEFWSDEKGRYVHIDPCENIIDAPLTYEKGWGKKETWVVAVGENQCVDVTSKYTQNIDECIRRRSPRCPEEWYAKYIKFKNKVFLSLNKDESERNEIIERQQKDIGSVRK